MTAQRNHCKQPTNMQSEAGLLADEAFHRTVAAIEKRLPLLDRLPRVRVKAWLIKLNEVTSNIVWKKNRNLYARLLLEQLRSGVLEVPFHGLPPQGSLPTLPAFLTYRYLTPGATDRQTSHSEAGPSSVPPEPIWIAPGRFKSQHSTYAGHHSSSSSRPQQQQHHKGDRSPDRLRPSSSMTAPQTPPGCLPASSPTALAGTWGGSWETSPAAAAATASAAAAAAAAARRYAAQRGWPGAAPAHGLRAGQSAQQQLLGGHTAVIETGLGGPRSPVEAFMEAAAVLNADADSPCSSQQLESRLQYAEAKLFEQELELQRLHAATSAAKRQLKAATRACLDDLLTKYGGSSNPANGGSSGWGQQPGAGRGPAGGSSWMAPWDRAGAEAAGASPSGCPLAASAAAAGGGKASGQQLPSVVEEALEPLYDLAATVDRVFAGVSRWPGAGYTRPWGSPEGERGRPRQQQQQQLSQKRHSSSRWRSEPPGRGRRAAEAAGPAGGDAAEAEWAMAVAGCDAGGELPEELEQQLLMPEASQDSAISGGPHEVEHLTPEASSNAVGPAGPLQHGLGPLAAARLTNKSMEVSEELDLVLQTFRSMLGTCSEQQQAVSEVLVAHLEEASGHTSRKAAKKLATAAAAAVQPLRQLLAMYQRHSTRLQDQAKASAAAAAALAAAAEGKHDDGSLLAETSQRSLASPEPGAKQQQQQQQQQAQQQAQQESHPGGTSRSEQMHAQLQQLLIDFCGHVAVVEQQLQVYSDRGLESAAAKESRRGSSSGGASGQKQGAGSKGQGSPDKGGACAGVQEWANRLAAVLEGFAQNLQQLQERADVLHWQQQQERLHDMQQRQQHVRHLEPSNSINATVGSCYSRASIGVREPLSAEEAAAAAAATNAAAAVDAESEEEPVQEEPPPPPLWQLIADTQPKTYKDESKFGNIVDYILSSSPRSGAAAAAGSTGGPPPSRPNPEPPGPKAAALTILTGGGSSSVQPSVPSSPRGSPLGGVPALPRSSAPPPTVSAGPTGASNGMGDRLADLSQQASKLLEKSNSLLGPDSRAGSTGLSTAGGLGGSALGRLADKAATVGMSSGGALLGGKPASGGGVPLSAAMASAWGGTNKAGLGSSGPSPLRRSGEGPLGGGLSGMSMGGGLFGGASGSSGMSMGGGTGLSFGGAALGGGGSSSSMLKPGGLLGSSMAGASLAGLSMGGRRL